MFISIRKETFTHDVDLYGNGTVCDNSINCKSLMYYTFGILKTFKITLFQDMCKRQMKKMAFLFLYFFLYEYSCFLSSVKTKSRSSNNNSLLKVPSCASPVAKTITLNVSCGRCNCRVTCFKAGP